MNFFRALRLLIPLMSVIALALSAVLTLATIKFLRNAEVVTATITANETQENEADVVLHRPQLEFLVGKKVYRVTPLSFVAAAPGKIGDRVPALYSRDNPSQACIDSFQYKWAWACITFGAGMFLGLLHFGLKRFTNRPA